VVILKTNVYRNNHSSHRRHNMYLTIRQPTTSQATQALHSRLLRTTKQSHLILIHRPSLSNYLLSHRYKRLSQLRPYQ
jgi:hypothetical protein